jgi:sugar phosphate isomerase/epimerase
MPYRLYAMDTCFYNSIVRYPFETRCEMQAELGFDATYLTCWSDQSWTDVKKLPTVKSKYGLDVAGVYGVADLTAPDPRLLNLFESLEGAPAIELAIKSAADDDDALQFLDRVLAICDRRDISIYLYPHINFYLERLTDAVRLCTRINHPRLGAMFCGFHWYAIDGQHLAAQLTDAAPYLRQGNLCGSRRDVDGLANKATIEPLDDGEMDNFAILANLRRVGFAGLIGFQGYSTGGDPYLKLKRSLNAFRAMEQRLQAHPSWGQFMG